MQVHVFESVAFDRLPDNMRRRVRRKTDVPYPALVDEFVNRLHAAALAQRPVKELGIVDAVQRQQVNVVELQVAHRFVEGVEELLLRGKRRNLGLDDYAIARQPWQHEAKLHLGRAVAARSLDVVNAQLERAVDDRLDVGLPLSRHLAGIDVIPLVLVTHPPTGKNRNLKLRLAEPPIFHVAEVLGFRRSDSRRTVYGQSLGQACNHRPTRRVSRTVPRSHPDGPGQAVRAPGARHS